jgi:septum formation protein
MNKERIILASASPRRRQLLEELGVRFDALPLNVPELDALSSPLLSLSPAELARENARRKARAVEKLQPGRWVLGADTVVALGDRLLGKPSSPEQAAEFLRALSGRTHEVITGCSLLSPYGKEDLFHDVSRVTFRELSDAAIADYLARVKVLDKAGGYALQEQGERIVERVEGSRHNVIGLPTEMLADLLKKRGLL